MTTTYDLVAFDGVGINTFQLADQSLFSQVPPGRLCTGKQKLTQKWLLEFLTETGSMPFHMATRGTKFLASLRSRALLNAQDVQAAFSFAELQIRQTLNAIDTADTPLDEKLVDATLVSLVLATETISLTIKLTTAAGTDVVFVAPISTVPASLA